MHTTMVMSESFHTRYATLLSHNASWGKHDTWLSHRGPQKISHRAYVGPEGRYGDMAASMFTLLWLSGMRESSWLLDVGCGSLRLVTNKTANRQAGQQASQQAHRKESWPERRAARKTTWPTGLGRLAQP